MLPTVLRQLGLLFKVLVAGLALERLRPRVYTQVIDEVAFLGKRFLAFVANKHRV